MSSDPAQPKRRATWKAALLLLAIYAIGILTGISGGLLVIRHELRQVFRSPGEAGAPIDRILQRFASEISRQANLTPEESVTVHDQMKSLSGRFKEARVHLADEVRNAVQSESQTMLRGIDPARREKVRELINRRASRWGLEVKKDEG